MRVHGLVCLLLLCMAPPAGAEDIVLDEQGSNLDRQVVENQSWGAGRLVKGKRARGKVAFTFDDGPDIATTSLILDTLESFEVPATFFVVGRRFSKKTATAGADLIADIARRGFTIGNHTSRHHRLDKQSFERGSRDIARNAREIAGILGYRPRLFRPPFGVITREIRKYVRQRGDTLVMWSIDPRDFQRTPDDVLRRRVVRQILNNNGGVVLLHDTKPWTARALPGILQDLEKENCRRLSLGRQPIQPVSLHYFMRDLDGKARPVPAEILNNTQAAAEKLAERCQNDD